MQGDLLVSGGLNFPGGFGLRRKKSLLLVLDTCTNFKINMVNTVK